MRGTRTEKNPCFWDTSDAGSGQNEHVFRRSFLCRCCTACLERSARCCPYNGALSEDAFVKRLKTSDELYVGRGAFDVELAPLNKLIIIIIIIIEVINTDPNRITFDDFQ